MECGDERIATPLDCRGVIINLLVELLVPECVGIVRPSPLERGLHQTTCLLTKTEDDIGEELPESGHLWLSVTRRGLEIGRNSPKTES